VLNVCGVDDVHATLPLVPEPGLITAEITIGSLKRYKSRGTNNILAKLIKAGREILYSEIHKLICSILNKDCHSTGTNVLLYQFTKRVIRMTNNYLCISLLSTAYKILSNIILARITPCVSEVTVDHQCGFHCNRSTIDQIFSLHQILEEKWEYTGTVHELFIDFREAYDSVKIEVHYNIVLEFCILMKLVRLIKMCLN
jgi:hypothetical protein